MKCKKCGQILENEAKFCPKCGNDMRQDQTTGEQSKGPDPAMKPAPNNNIVNRQAPKKKKSKAGKVLLIMLIVLVAICVGISLLINNSVYKQVVDYDDLRSDETQMTIVTEYDDDTVQYEIDLELLNAYIDEVDFVDEIEDIGSNKAKDIAFDLDDQLIYLLIKDKSGKYIDVEFTYDMSIEDDSLFLEVICNKLGEASSLMAIGRAAPFLAIESINIPLPDEAIKTISSQQGDRLSQKISFDRVVLEYEVESDQVESTQDGTTSDNTTDSNTTGNDGIDYEDTWTIMIYMNGSDLEYDSNDDTYQASGSTDLSEMMAGHTSDKVNVVVETGGTLSWYKSEINGDHNQRFLIEDAQLKLQEDLDRRSMCDPNTLVSFANWAIDEYPADNYALILWDHGGGSLGGFGYDLYFPQDTLDLPEIRSALSEITSTKNMKFELVGFDACLMGTVETALLIQPYANYYIASEELEPGHGWDYESVMRLLNDDSIDSGDKLGKEIIYGFIDQATSHDSNETITLSTIDLDMVDEVAEAFDNLITLVLSDVQSDPQMNNKILGTIPKLLEFNETDHYDLCGFAREMIQFYPAEANRLLGAMDDAVVASGAGYNTSTVGGMSFYIPYYDQNRYNVYRDLYKNISISEKYTNFCEYIVAGKQTAVEANVQPEYTLGFDQRPFTITFEPDYYDNYLSNVFINIYEVYNDGGQSILYDYGFDAYVMDADTPYVMEEYFSSWPCMFGQPLSIEVEYADEKCIIYSAPIRIYGDEATLQFTYYHEDTSYHIDGYVFISNEENSNDNTLYELQIGDQVELGYETYEIDTEEGYYSFTNPVEITNDNLLVEEWELATGSYVMRFVIEDYTGQMHYTEEYAVFDFD